MGTRHNIVEYQFAKDVVKEFPRVKKVLDDTEKMLYNQRHFLCVQHVLDAIHESQEMINRQYVYYKTVLDRKGREEK